MKRLGVVALAAITLAGCTSGPPAPTRLAKNGAHPGGTITVGITPPSAVEPSNAFEPAAAALASTTCDTLVQLDTATGELRPALAEAWVISDSGKRITVKLRKGVRFHNGGKMSANDVVFSLSRLASLDNASNKASLMRPVLGYEFVHGDKATDDEHRRTQLLGLKVLEGSSFEIKLSRPDADFLRVLADVATAPVPRRAAESDPDGFARHPDCVGAYKLAKEWSPSDAEVVVTRDERYYRSNKGRPNGGAGYADRIVFRVFPDQAAAVAAYEAEQVDVTFFGADQVARARAFGGDFVAASRGGVELIGLPTGVAPFSDPMVRRALSMALDRPRAIANGLGGAGAPATGFLPPNVADVFTPDRCAAAAPAAPDVAAAKAIIADTGVRFDGRPFRIYFNDEYGNRALAEDVAAQWRATLGLDAVPTPLGWDKYLSTGRGAPGFDGPFRASWRGDHTGPDAYLGPLFHSGAIGESNLSRFADSAYDRALDRGGRETTDAAARLLDYRNLERRACEAMPMVPVAFVQGGTLVRRSKLDTAGEALDEIATGLPALRELFVR
jgi:oligopeptide transport system substrate-binding protein